MKLKPLNPIAYPKTKEELEALRIKHGKFVRPIHIAAHALVPMVTKMSPSRSVMSIGMAGQHLVWSKMEKPTVITGVEYEFGDYAFSDQMPENGTILAVIPRYPRTTESKIKHNPETIVIYVSENNEIDYFSITPWEKHHSHFGYMKRFHQENISKLKEGQVYPKGAKFAESPGVAEDGFYMMGFNAMTAYIEDEVTAEDGIMVESSFADENLVVDILEEREISLGTNDFPIETWPKGAGEDFGIFPEIGDFIESDGKIMVKRKYDPVNAPVLMSNDAIRSPEGISDEYLYSRPTAIKLQEDGSLEVFTPGQIVDIVVLRNPRAKKMLPPTMSGQLERYALAYQTFLHNILKAEQRITNHIRRSNPTAQPNFSPKLRVLLHRARGLTSYNSNRLQGPVEFLMRRMRMEEWTINFTIHHRRKPAPGDKFCGQFGDKGVAVAIMPKEYFPGDSVVMVASTSTFGRTNSNRAFVPEFATSARNLTKEIKDKLKVVKGKLTTPSYFSGFPQDLISGVWARLMKFYAITSPILYRFYAHEATDSQKLEHLAAICNEKVYCLMPEDNPIDEIDAKLQLDEHFPVIHTTHTYRNRSGKMETTKDPVVILEAYMYYLEKISEDGSADSFGKLQHHGLLASRSSVDQHKFNFRQVSTRNFGQHETEILVHDARSEEVVAELLDRSNNPATMRHICKKLLTMEKPLGSVDNIVDRKEIPLGNHRPGQILRHGWESMGAKISYMDEREAAIMPNLEKTIARTK